MSKPAIALSLAVGVAVVALAVNDAKGRYTAVGAPACSPARVDYGGYPGGDRQLDRLPWIRGTPRRVGLAGLLWYWPSEWTRRRVPQARIFTGGAAPAGYSTKILWIFTGEYARGRAATQLRVRGRRLDAPGAFTQQFQAVSYAAQRGAPSYASIIDVPTPGCWRLHLATGRLRASVDLLAVPGARPPSEDGPVACAADEVRALVGRFIGAFNAGDLEALDAVFAQEPDFEWYATDGPGDRVEGRDRASLVPYFRERHAFGERLELRTFRFNGNTPRSRPYGNFEYTLLRDADDLPAASYSGKGAALCYRSRPDVIFVWAMAPA